jgi:hypothetical protein
MVGAQSACTACFETKLPNLVLKTQLKQLLVYLLSNIVLHAATVKHKQGNIIKH